jgi:hypothetical protein
MQFGYGQLPRRYDTGLGTRSASFEVGVVALLVYNRLAPRFPTGA